jgi:CDP-diacylglycerol--serine O-phosphatidyltransferase
MNDQKRLAFFLPNIFTALNLGCGFVAILLASEGEFYMACLAIALGSIFDAVDGRVARMTGTESAFGEQFDSLSDLVSFGIAPGLIFYFKFFSDLGRAGVLCAFIFTLCGALRLARFNANIEVSDPNNFQGMPIPGAATALIGYTLLALDFGYLNNQFFTIPYVIFYAILMISNIPFPSFKSSPWLKKNKKQVLVLIFAIIGSILLYEKLMILVVISTYVFVSIIHAFMNRKTVEVFDWPNDEE